MQKMKSVRGSRARVGPENFGFLSQGAFRCQKISYKKACKKDHGFNPTALGGIRGKVSENPYPLPRVDHTYHVTDVELKSELLCFKAKPDCSSKCTINSKLLKSKM